MFLSFLFQGQTWDEDVQLAYNRFRWYSPDTGTYISQDPIGLAGNNPNLYGYVFDSNTEIDPFGLDVVTISGIKVTGFTVHGVNRAISRGVSPANILDVVKNPLKVGDIKVDNMGRSSQRFIGMKAEVVINPETGRVISINPTSTKKAMKLCQ
ncbi:MAG: RHS repeat-associated core domain-containing protein [Bacteroidales bacterium]